MEKYAGHWQRAREEAKIIVEAFMAEMRKSVRPEWLLSDEEVERRIVAIKFETFVVGEQIRAEKAARENS